MSQPPSKRRRTELSLADKVKLIKDAESTRLTRQQLGQKYGIGKTTATDIIRKKAEYLRQYEENANGSRQRFKTTSKFEEINDLTWTWFQQARAKNIPISGPMLQEKGLSFAASLGVEDFKASNGWLDSWKSRHAVKASRSAEKVRCRFERSGRFQESR
ncbi:tigger transposable element-derived protein 4-like [Ptychodera flava]|uniref:tigger transposable element-derived protein 4-like n=1 Tax=Ptychodera flava TaxID=63121 RepID=UPI00396A0DA6